MTRGTVPKLLLTELESNLCFSLTLPRAISISTAIKHCVQRLWLQIEEVMNVQSMFPSDLGMSSEGFSQIQILN